MTDYFYITGTSRGLGRALAERILQDDDSFVIGMARGEGPAHPDYEHVNLDLTDLEAVGAFAFRDHSGTGRIVLVNNSGMLTPSFLGGIPSQTIAQTYAVNVTAPVILMNAFLAAYRHLGASLVICNVSSIGASIPMAGGGLYCATKAALDMTTRVIAREAELAGLAGLSAFSVDPGALDTAMQQTLRNASEADFPTAARNRQMKAEGRLASAEATADALLRVLKQPKLASDVVFRLQDLAAG